MKSSTTVPCACGKQIPLEIRGSALPEYAKCIDCGVTTYLMAPLGNIVTMLLVERAKRELAHDDITISTLLRAVAVEAEMAYLFFKWKADRFWQDPRVSNTRRQGAVGKRVG